MIRNLIMFDEIEDIEKLTGLTHEKLWEVGFDLDDWDCGFMSDAPIDDGWLLNEMEGYCVGSNHVEYDGKHWYTVHHA